MKTKHWWLIGSLLAGILILGGGYYVWLAPAGASRQSKQFVVQSGEGIGAIAEHLHKEGLIKSPWGFKVYLKLTGQVIVQPGTYELSSHQNLPIIANLIASGATSNVTLTIPEGWTLQQIAEEIAQKNIATAEEFLKIANDFPPDYDFLKARPAGKSLEGFLFPDTYKLIKGDPLLAIRQMLDNFSNKYHSDIQPDLGDQDLYKILIVASLVEREAQKAEDRPMIAGVIYNRLKIGMKLDIDATVRFIINNWKDPLTQANLTVNSPYNTRKYAGLPPGPICNPGLAAVEAALHPAEHKYYYYLTDPEGVTHYAKTLAEHNQNKLEYLL